MAEQIANYWTGLKERFLQNYVMQMWRDGCVRLGCLEGSVETSVGYLDALASKNQWEMHERFIFCGNQIDIFIYS